MEKGNFERAAELNRTEAAIKGRLAVIEKIQSSTCDRGAFSAAHSDWPGNYQQVQLSRNQIDAVCSLLKADLEAQLLEVLKEFAKL